jgi:1-acyl-sn-glycerol-3-phosphate acyltransferase
MVGLLKAAASLVLYVLVLVLSIVLFGVGVAMLPFRLLMKPRSFTRLYLYIADYYWKFAVWFGEFVGIQIALYGDNVPLRENAFVISNHRWGVDFVVYWMLAARKGRLGCLKLMAKDWLKFFPGFGWGGYLLDFVFLKRDWQQDQNTIRDTFHRLKTRDLPFWLLSHVEGTRLTPEKLEESKRFARERGLPVMEETLFPRVKVRMSLLTLIV